MNYALSRPSPVYRGGLLSLVIGLHAAIFALVMAAKIIAPQIIEMPLVVELLQAPDEQRPPETRPKPEPRPEIPRPRSTPAAPQKAPPLEATQSTQPAPTAPVAAPAEAKPTPPAPPAPEQITQARFDADYLRNPAPPYPPLAKRMGEEGKVILRVSVTTQGIADMVEIKTSSGSQRLDESAQKTVRNWKFIPAKRGDTTNQSWVLVPIIFKMEH